MKIVAIIPARWASTRFPAKPLADIEGKPMVVRVLEQVERCPAISSVLVATDHARIQQAVEEAGGTAIMTSPDHQSGTDRCWEAYQRWGQTADFVLNVQGDEPYLKPSQLNLICSVLTPQVELATLVKQIKLGEQLLNANVVKAVRAQSGEALYFSRAALPFRRDLPPTDWLEAGPYWQHIGVYAYRTDILQRISRLPASPLEEAEKLEQLRWLEAGYRIQTAETTESSVGIDSPEDLARALAAYPHFYDQR